MGNEYEGIAWDYLRKCNSSVRIPMVGTIRSLNVSVATGILLFEVTKQRIKGLGNCRDGACTVSGKKYKV